MNALAERFGVSKSAIWRVQTGLTWSHVSGLVAAKTRIVELVLLD